MLVRVYSTTIEQNSLTVFMLNEHSTVVYLGKEHVEKNVNMCPCMNILNQSKISDINVFNPIEYRFGGSRDCRGNILLLNGSK